ncbi:MAG: glycosyltransferase family 2 protein [Thermotogae bacterium]|nr:glycosyltransferase family 2 protein [Thermotogota bacterium]
MRLSIVIPVYNERKFFPIIFQRVRTIDFGIPKEIVVVDDFSTDGTRDYLRQHVEGLPNVKVVYHERNMGKGAALHTAFAHVSGDIVAIQDADLEYDPQDLIPMVKLILDGHADVVYGSRFYGRPHRILYHHHFMGNKLISFLVNLFSDMTFSDIEVCYKVFKREVLDHFDLTLNDFGFEVEFTMKVSKTAKYTNWRIYEMGISYHGRTYAEGKKINWRDGLKALFYVLKFAFWRPKLRDERVTKVRP